MSTAPWTGDAIAHEVPGCYVFDRWGRQFIAHEDLGICCCVMCHSQRYGDPIGTRHALGWDGKEIGHCHTCQRRADDAATRPLAGAVTAPRCSDGELLRSAYARGGYNAVRLLLDLNPWMEKVWLGE